MDGTGVSIGVCISSHGFGHATRALAVMEQLQRRNPDVRFKIFTRIPEFLFRGTVTGYSYHACETDVGVIQKNAIHCDIAETRHQLERFMHFLESRVAGLLEEAAGCELILCDISPLGIELGKKAGVPTILVENFTWDWIYRQLPGLESWAGRMEAIYSGMNGHRIQAEPVCSRVEGTIRCPPIFREIREKTENVRRKLGLDGRRLVVVSLGGIGYRLDRTFFAEAEAAEDCLFVVAAGEELAGSALIGRSVTNIVFLAPNSELYHPDLIAAADLVLCKSGYSTIAECLQGGTRLVLIDRKDFPENRILTRFAEERLAATVIAERELGNGRWLDAVRARFMGAEPRPASCNGAVRVAEYMLSCLRQ